jgi:CRP/FNR family transcriptional regulator, cyclic AMP receptor protein
MKQRRFAAGQRIFAEGDPSDVAYIIVAGSVEIIKTTATGELLLAVLRAGDIFGEMGLIDEAPRSAGARAAQPVTATAIGRDEFIQLVLSGSEQGLALLRTLFERMRTTNQLLVAEREARGWLERQQARRVQLMPTTPETGRALPGDGLEVERFPLRIGRKPQGIGETILACNEIELDDRSPYRVSLNHMAIDLEGDAVLVRDRGSHHGVGVNGTRIGGDDLWTALALTEGMNEIVVGPADSPFRFAVTVGNA